jgi:hypothetical protein
MLVLVQTKVHQPFLKIVNRPFKRYDFSNRGALDDLFPRFVELFYKPVDLTAARKNIWQKNTLFQRTLP